MIGGSAASAVPRDTATAASVPRKVRRDNAVSLAISWPLCRNTRSPIPRRRGRAGVYIAAPAMGLTSVRAAFLAAAVVVAAPASQTPPPQPPATDILRGTIDIHVHSDPDNVPRSVDGLEAAKQARAKGMRGIVLKNHYDPTAGLAYLARKETPGLEVFGGIDLNLSVG